MPSVVMFPAGQSELIFDVPIRDEAFLQVGGRFRVTLTEVKLVAGRTHIGIKIFLKLQFH